MMRSQAQAGLLGISNICRESGACSNVDREPLHDSARCNVQAKELVFLRPPSQALV